MFNKKPKDKELVVLSLKLYNLIMDEGYSDYFKCSRKNFLSPKYSVFVFDYNDKIERIINAYKSMQQV